MQTAESIQQAFGLAHSLHPHREVAWEVTRDALKLNRVISYRQDARPEAGRPYKQKLRESNLLRLSVLMASEKWEKDQESRSPKLTPAYTPTKEDLLYRYLKTLVLHTMDRPSVYAAVGVGALLFSYRTSEVAMISVDHFDDLNIRRKKEWLFEKVASRFRDVMVIPSGYDSKGVPPPTEYQLAFVNKSLATLSPLTDGHPQDCLTGGGLLGEYFCYNSPKTEVERVHLITNMECCGWPRLVEQYNQFSPHNQMDDPASKLSLPLFDDGYDGGPRSRSSDDVDGQTFGERFEAEPLSPLEVRALMQRNGYPSPSRKAAA
jgi:hypothetical protein